MADVKTINEKKRKEEGTLSDERAEAVRAEADRIASQILTLTRNGLFVSLRFLDLALCQFEYINSDKIRGISTTGQHIIYSSQYVIENYMKDRQALSRDYLHMVLHCVFRHPFVSENLNEEYWNLATDIAVETIIDELDLRQTATKNCDEVGAEVARIKKMMRHVTAEQVYQMLLSGAFSQKDIEYWEKLFYRDDHRVWWEIARQIAEELKRRQEEEKKEEPPESDRENKEYPQDEDEGQEEENAEDEGENPEEGQEDEASEEDGEESEEDSGDAGEDGGDSGEEDQEEEEGSEESEENSGDDSEEGEEGGDSGEDGEDGEEGEDSDEYEEEYSSTPGQSMERENPDDIADPDSDTQESGNDSDGEGTGGGKPDEKNPQQSDEEGSSRKNDQSGEGLEGQDDHHRPEGKNNGADSLEGRTDEGRRDDSMGDDPFGDEQHQNSGALSDGGSNSKGSGQQGQHSAGTGGGGDGSQSAWEHESGGANRRDGGEKNAEDRRQLSGDANPDTEQEMSQGEIPKEEAVPTEASKEGGDQEEKEPSYMHSGEEQEELKDKWKDLSERILVDLQTSSKEWGERSDTMLQGVKKINRDKYDYSTFLRKFATMREDIQINPEEFDYVYYTFGMERYGNIPLIEPLEYKEVKKVRDFVIAIDTSGSCAGEVVQKFLDKTYSLFTQQENFFKKINLHIIQCDAQIQSDVKITCKEEFDDYVRDLEFKGFGGTDFRPVFEYVNEMIERKEFDDLKGLIYFTDGNGTYPQKRPPYETAFVFVDDDEFEYEVPSWAMKLVLETSDIMQEVLI